MSPKARMLAQLDHAQLKRVALAQRIPLPPGGVTTLRTRLSRSTRLGVEGLLDVLTVEELRPLCRAFGRATSGARGPLVDRLLGWDLEDERRSGEADADDETESGPELEGEAEYENRFRTVEYAREFQGEMARSSDPVLLRDYQSEAVRTLVARLAPSQPVAVGVATGGGKTVIGNEVVVDRLAQGARPVLWVTKDWRLLFQAARDLVRRHVPVTHLRRIGGDGTRLHPLAEGTAGPFAVAYTTLQTFGRRHANQALGAFRPALIVWDECHWGEHAKAGRRLLSWARRCSIPVLGLTATPRDEASSAFTVGFSRDFASLVRAGHLAAPIPCEPVRTGVDWLPRRSFARGDFDTSSVRDLGRDRKRNERIVSHYAKNRARYGRTIVFACSVEHADVLARAFAAPPYGIPARAIHSRRPPAEVDDALRDFESGRIDVLINVAMLTHGIDVPATRSVFLCRPTMSDILFSQMIGRASRRHAPSGKTQFNVVEFTDNLQKFGDLLVDARRFFQGAGGGSGGGRAPHSDTISPTLRGHSFDSAGAARWVPDDPLLPEAMRGLWYRQGQTFGVEIELTRDGWDGSLDDAAWSQTAEPLRTALVSALGSGHVAPRCFPAYGDPRKDHAFWNVERDNSAGWEITSRILRDAAGMQELVRACAAIAAVAPALGLKVNWRTGLHLHLGWLGRGAEEVRRAIRLVRLFEPALATLVSPSRLARYSGGTYATQHPNEYCRPLSKVYPARALADAHSLRALKALRRDHQDRFVTFNLRPLERLHTVEVRMHHGTFDAAKILLWLSLWQQLLWAAGGDRPIPDVPDRKVITPEGDIVALARTWFPRVEQPTFEHRLRRRRAEVLELWRRHPDLAAWLPAVANWERAPSPVVAANDDVPVERPLRLAA